MARSALAQAIVPVAVALSLIACAPGDADRSISERAPLSRQSDRNVARQPGISFDSGTAVLADGPYRRTGVDALGINVIIAWRGDYTVFNESGPTPVTVEYVDRPIDFPPWDRITCEQQSLLVAPTEGVTVYVRTELDGRSFFFTFPAGIDVPCRFVVRFLSEFDFFRGAAEDESLPPFPAILDVS